MNRMVDGEVLRLSGKGKKLEILTKMEGDTAIMFLKGSVTSELETDLTDEILAFISVGKNIQLNLAGLEHISSTCQKRLVEIQSRYVEKKGVELILSNVPPRMYALFRSCRLDTQLRIRQEE